MQLNSSETEFRTQIRLNFLDIQNSRSSKMPDMSKYRSELNLTISFGYRKLMSEGNACAEGGKARDRRGRVMRGRSMSEGQTTNGER